MLGLVLLEIFEAQLQLGDLGIQPFGRLTILLASQRRQLRPQMSDFDCGSAKLGACSSQLVPQCGDLSLGRAICQVHIAILPERRPHVQHEHPARAHYFRHAATSGRAVQAGILQSIPSNSIETCAAVIVTVPLPVCGQTNRACGSSSRLA